MDKMRKIAVQILDRLERTGFEAYLVGGCVRDCYLGITPKDYDICTNALPDQIIRIFTHTVPTGLKHGTVTVVEQGIPFEVTTFRVESKYHDHRRPVSVTFVSQLKDDLARRDFTMNAMAQDRQGKIYDYFNGRGAIEAKQIRSVGKANQRFTEDALRMIRAIRFAAQFQFSLDPELIDAINVCKKTLIHLSIERVVLEIEKIWQAPQPSVGIRLLDQLALFAHLPIFSSWEWSEFDRDQFTGFDWVDDRIIHWAYLFYLGKIPIHLITDTCRDLALSKSDCAQIADCLRMADQWHEKMPRDHLKRLLLRFGLTTIVRAYQLSQLMQMKKPEDEMIESIRRYWDQMPVKKLTDLSINGHDLLSHIPKKPGPWIRELLHELFIRVALEELPNQQPILLKVSVQQARKMNKSDGTTE